MSSRNNLGFTLIEVLVALAIFAVMAALAVGGMANLVASKEAQTSHASAFNATQLGYAMLQQDLSQVVKRAVKLPENKRLPSFIGEVASGRPQAISSDEQALLAFTRAGLPNPQALAARSTLQRVEYFLLGKNLMRRTWPNLDPHLDPANPDVPNDKLLLAGVNSLQLDYLDVAGNTKPSWRLATTTPVSTEIDERVDLPVAVIMKLDLENYGAVEWWFALPGGRRALAL